MKRSIAAPSANHEPGICRHVSRKAHKVVKVGSLGPICPRRHRPGLDRRSPDGDRGFRAWPRAEDRPISADHQNKPGRRHQHRQGGSTSRRSTCSSISPAGVGLDRQPCERENVVNLNPGFGVFRSHRSAMFAEHRALGLHTDARQRHRQGAGQTGGETWFFLTADYAFGHALERDTAAVVTANGGKVVGGVTSAEQCRLSSFLLQAQSSKAKIIGLAMPATPTRSQAAEFGIVSGGRSSRACCCSSPTFIRSD